MNNSHPKHLNRIALLVACASVLQIVESYIPHPMPGVRLGLANMITLVALISMGFKASLEIALLRTVLSSLFLGTFMSPSFVISFLGAAGSAVVMGLIHTLALKTNRIFFSIIGLSLLGSVTHNTIQILLVYFFLIPHKSIFLLVPLIGISSVVMGWISGVIAVHVCKKIDIVFTEHTAAKPFSDIFSKRSYALYTHGDSLIHRINPVVKTVSLIVFAGMLSLTRDLTLYLFVFLMQLLLVLISRISIKSILLPFKKILGLLIISFCIPLFFIRTGDMVVGTGFLTYDGLYTGVVYAGRIILLMLSAVLLTLTTSPEQLIIGIKGCLKPFTIFGISEDRIASILINAWMLLPALLHKTRFININKATKPTLRHVIPAFSNWIISIFHEHEHEHEQENNTKDTI